MWAGKAHLPSEAEENLRKEKRQEVLNEQKCKAFSQGFCAYE